MTSNISDSVRHTGEEPAAEGVSKTSRKRAMAALQDLGAELVSLSAEQLARMALPETLGAAIVEAQRLTRKNEALRRQMQYIGKLMRAVDPAPIAAQLEVVRGFAASETARLHRLEQLRAELLADDKVAGKIAARWPQADIQHLRTLRRNALKEREAGRPPKAFREIFKALRELDCAGNEGGAEPGGAGPDDGFADARV
jgi:ribosome-associated protein